MTNPQADSIGRRRFLWAGASACAAAAAPGILRAQPGRRPNIVVILADDLGYGELGAQGARDIPTPHIDSIARNGVRLTDGYASCPICSPTRAGLMTGRYQQRFGFETNPGPAGYAAKNFGLPRSETTLAERLKELGYSTGMAGKWHVGFREELSPPRRGFDSFFGFLDGAHDYVPGARPGRILRGTQPVEEKEYLTDAFGREAAAFIDGNRSRPFFLYLAFNAVHTPMQSVEKYAARFPRIQNSNRRTYAGMTAAMDDAVGRVLSVLRANRLEENTLIIFLSDNGGPTPQNTSSNLPLRGYKAQVYEGGIRVPFMAQWKGRLASGSVYRSPAISLDVHATALAAAGGRITPEMKLDGVDLMPYLTGRVKTTPHETLYWRLHASKAIRRGIWKLTGDRGAAWELYNLKEDIGEKNDLAAKMPEKVRELDAAWQAWNAQLMDPRWVRQDAATQSGAAGDRRPARASGAGSPEERFRALDRDDDGKLSPAELPNQQLFQRMDADGDGFVTMEEARRGLAGTRKGAK